jgi:hypothetical protein
MAKLGYQKYLQKIYVAIDVDVHLTSPYYQLPLVIAILDAVGMLRLHQDVHVIGRFLADYSLLFPAQTSKPETATQQLFTVKSDENIRLEQFLNRLHTEPIPYTYGEFDLRELFPGVTFTNERLIDFGATSLDVLKRISPLTLQERTLYVSLRCKPLVEQKLMLLQRLSLTKKMKLFYTQCFCEKHPCVCSKELRDEHQRQVALLENLY